MVDVSPPALMSDVPRSRVASQRLSVLDVCFAVAVALIGLLGLRSESARPIALVLDLALAPALIWRRRSPTLAFSAIAAVVVVQFVINPVDRFGGRQLTPDHVMADLALLVAFYTVAAHEPRRRTMVAAAVLEIALLSATLHWGGRNGAVLFVLLSGMAAAAGISGDNVRTRRAYLASLEQRAAALEVERDQQVQLAAAAERARIARDMHDVVAHNISVMIALADGASYTAATNAEQAAEAMAQVAATGRQALGEMRRLLGVLRDGDQPAAVQPQPGLADLENLLAQVRLTGLQATLITEGPLPPLPPGLELAIYRLVQESLTNTLKHAIDAEAATVRLRLRDRRLEVDVIDDGSRPSATPHPGQGISGMQERAAVYGGTIQVGPQATVGWRVHACFDAGSWEPAS